LAEHFDRMGDYEVRITKNNVVDGEFKIISSHFYSRHSNSTEYFVVLKYIANDENSIQWKCSCLSGQRTCGCCSHIAALIYYLSFARFQPDSLKNPGMSLSRAIICIKKDEFSDDELDILENEFSSGNIDLNKDTDELNLILDQNCPKNEKLKRNISITDQLDISFKKKKN
jgi:hypothetical protein